MNRRLQLAPVAWSDQAAALLARALRRSTTTVDNIRHGCATGRMTLWCVSADQAAVGYYVTWIDALDCGDELVIVAATGRLPGVPLTRAVLPAIEALAAGGGCSSVRVHSIRQGMLKTLARHGYAPAEIVYRKVIA